MAYCFAIALRSQRCDPVVLMNLLLSFPALAAFWVAAHISSQAFAGIYVLITACFTALYARYLSRFLRILGDAR
jgi:hypothetical protein